MFVASSFVPSIPNIAKELNSTASVIRLVVPDSLGQFVDK